METVNSQQVQRVWQRLQGTAPASPDPLEPLINGEWEASSACLALARRTGGKFGPLLRQLAQHSRSRWACLQGYCLLQTGKRPRHTHPANPTGTTSELLQKCLKDGLCRVGQYQQAAEALGAVGQLLAQEQTRDCRQLLEILGNWEN